MSDQSQTFNFDHDLGNHGAPVVIDSPQALTDWNNQESSSWQWLGNALPAVEETYRQHQEFRQNINRFADQWRQCQNNTQRILEVHSSIRISFESYYKNRRIFHSSSPEAKFLREVQAKRGDHVAAGAYLALLRARFNAHQGIHSDLVAGLFEGFLYAREIDWTAFAHQEVLNGLKKQYSENLSLQNDCLKQIEITNTDLNKAFDVELRAKSAALENLQCEQRAELKLLIEGHVAKLNSIEKTYDQKLALQKPVEYWQAKESYHTKRAMGFGLSALVVTVALAIGMAFLLRSILSELKPSENPQHWQVGVLVTAGFFSIWFVRILVRMFLSHQHLATDSAERRMMILTYLAMARDGVDFAKEDKMLIIQHIFRSASDGLVKDDAAPPTITEWITRK